MEIVEVECICKICQNKFLVKKECHNKLEAEILEAKIQKRRKPVCPACYKVEQRKNAIQTAAKLGLPELIGRSEKQIAFAFSLRDAYISRHKGEVQRVMEEMKKVNPAKVRAAAENRGIEYDACIEEAFQRLGLHKAYLCIAEVNAQKLIDVLNG